VVVTNNLIVKIDQLAERGDVEFCRQIGANYIGIPIANASELERLAQLTGGDASDVSLRLDLREISEDESVKICRQQRPKSVDFVGHFVPSKATCDCLLSEGFELFFSNIEASYDTDPSWILSRYEELWGLERTSFQVDLLEQTEDAWRILRDEVSDEYDELSIEDINSLSQQHNLVVNLNFTPRNICEIMRCLPRVLGVALSLETCGFRRSYSLEEVKEIIEAIPQVE